MIYAVAIAAFILWIVISVIKTSKETSKYSDTMKFVVGVCFPTNAACECGVTTFGGGGKEDAGVHKKRLKKNWDISDKESLEHTVEWLINEGHYGESQAYFEAYRENPSNIKIPGSIKQHFKDEVIEKIDHVVHKEGILGWDLCRAANIVGWGYIAGYLTYEEAFVKSVEICKLIQAHFNSWEELLDSYLVGHFYWSQDVLETLRRDKRIQSELKDEKGAFGIAWETPLAISE